MSRVVVVSNRVADHKQSAAAGGLAVGVGAALENGGGVWFGWNGQLTDGEPLAPQIRVRRGVTYATVALNKEQFELYYNGFCNNTLWPLFHYRAGFFDYDRAQFGAYLAINESFARGLVPLLQPEDLIWVHDFHLIPLGARLRQAGVTQPLGFFLHTPFPSAEVLRALPVYEDVLRDLCVYDVVGFQTRRDLRAFQDAVTQPEIGGRMLADDTVQYRDRIVRADVFPIGIDVEGCARLAATHEHSRQLERIALSLQGRKLLIGVDRLDYSKGIPKRFQAFQKLLDAYPETHRNVVFMQIAAPTRIGVPVYTEIRHELERSAGHINGRFAEADWMPLRYLNRAVERGTLMALFRLARIGLVTPIRDGMNLVAKEYVAAQDPADPGVLVLSTMAGAAAELEDSVLVNPHDIEAMAEGIYRGLRMPLEERRTRHAAMMRALSRNDIDVWRRRFVEALAASKGSGAAAERRGAGGP